MLAIVINGLKADEEYSKQALEKFVDLTQMHAQF